jgi:recombination DNA repair RAD52 pathway protein
LYAANYCSAGQTHLEFSNPFREQVPRISEFTAEDLATLQSRLDRQLGPEYVSYRQGPGGSLVPYLAAEKAINLANEVFGFNGWSSSIQNIQLDFVRGKYKLWLDADQCRWTKKMGEYRLAALPYVE